jgi:hypothetical protein
MLKNIRKNARRIASLLLFLLIVAIIFLLSSCGASYQLRQADRHLKKAIALGARVDTLTKTRLDTFKIIVFKDKIFTKVVVDTARLDSLCRALNKQEQPEPIKKEIVKKIQKQICPQIKIDSTYNIELQAQGKKYLLPVTVHILSSGGDFTYSIVSGNLQFLFKESTSTVVVKPGRSNWYYAGLIFGALIIGFIAGYLTKAGPGKNLTINIAKEKPSE